MTVKQELASERWTVVKPRRKTRRASPVKGGSKPTQPVAKPKKINKRRKSRDAKIKSQIPILSDEDMRIYIERANIINSSAKLIVTEQDTNSLGYYGLHQKISNISVKPQILEKVPNHDWKRKSPIVQPRRRASPKIQRSSNRRASPIRRRGSRDLANKKRSSPLVKRIKSRRRNSKSRIQSK
jgi:hypothetical protein